MLSRLSYRLGQLVGVLAVAIVAIVALAMLVLVARVSWWLVTEHQLAAAAAALVGGSWAIHRNIRAGRL